MSSFWMWWQQLPLNIDPIAFSVARIPVYWYALFFLGGAFFVYYFSGKEYIKRGIFSRTQYKDFAFWVFVSALIGGKIGFLLLYWYPFVFHARGFSLPQAEGLALPGMSFIGGVIGGALYVFWFAKKHHIQFFHLTDCLVLFLPVAIFFGRLGNFFHGELKGRITETLWGMYFPGETILRHPSTLYAAFLEGMLLFSLLFFFTTKKQAPGVLTVYFLILYGIFRFISEFFREPDAQIGYIGMLTLNQMIAAFVCVVGMILFSIQNAKK